MKNCKNCGKLIHKPTFGIWCHVELDIVHCNVMDNYDKRTAYPDEGDE